jgi:pimeloyl-ACP methyl ester carboxylesterase
MWDANVDAMAADRQVLTWDMRGHGRSDSPSDPSNYSVQDSVEDIVALMDALDAPRAVLAGMSLGGYLSLAFHARHPERVAALILVDTGPGFRRDSPRQEWNVFAEGVAAKLESDGTTGLPASPEVAEHPDVNGLVWTARRVMAQQDAHVIESLGQVRVPALIVVGALDTGYLRSADYMAAKILGARKIVLEGAGHAANIDAAAAFNSGVLEFLEEI